MKRLIAATLIILISGCATSSPAPSIIYYLLDDSRELINSPKKAKATEVMVLLPTLSSYLRQPNLVMKGNKQKVIVANYHLWADPLANSIHRAIKMDLISGSDDLLLVETCDDCAVIRLVIDHFYPSLDGNVHLTGHYAIHYQQQTANHPFSLLRVQTEDGYSAAVADMRVLVKELSHRIKQSLLEHDVLRG